jgi:hypothetical protein
MDAYQVIQQLDFDECLSVNSHSSELMDLLATNESEEEEYEIQSKVFISLYVFIAKCEFSLPE